MQALCPASQFGNVALQKIIGLHFPDHESKISSNPPAGQHVHKKAQTKSTTSSLKELLASRLLSDSWVTQLPVFFIQAACCARVLLLNIHIWNSTHSHTKLLRMKSQSSALLQKEPDTQLAQPRALSGKQTMHQQQQLPSVWQQLSLKGQMKACRSSSGSAKTEWNWAVWKPGMEPHWANLSPEIETLTFLENPVNMRQTKIY